MSLEIAYAAMGGDLETVRGRLLTDERIEKFAKIFLQDTSMQTLESALEAGDLPEAYRGAHTLKGVSRDLASRRCSKPPPPCPMRCVWMTPACRPTWKRSPSLCRPCATLTPRSSTPSLSFNKGTQRMTETYNKTRYGRIAVILIALAIVHAAFDFVYQR